MLVASIPKMLFFPPFLLLLPLLPTPCQSSQCQNVIRVKDLLHPEGLLHFQNVQLLTFDGQKKPSCDHQGKAAIHLPGWLQLLSGDVHIRKPFALSNPDELVLALTLEQESLWVGRICEKGHSQSAFLSDDFCSLPFCQILPAACQSLASVPESSQSMPLSAFFPEGQWLQLDPIFHPMLEGQWQGEAELLLLEGGKEPGTLLAKVGLEGWHSVRADEHQEL